VEGKRKAATRKRGGGERDLRASTREKKRVRGDEI